MTLQRTSRLGAAALAVVGVIHLVLAPEYLSEQPYLGVLFVAGGIACAIFAAGLWRGGDAASWTLGALTMAGMGIGFVLSRTTGLPGFHETEWEPSGLVCLVLEAGFLLLAARSLGPARRRDGRLVPLTGRS